MQLFNMLKLSLEFESIDFPPFCKVEQLNVIFCTPRLPEVYYVKEEVAGHC